MTRDNLRPFLEPTKSYQQVTCLSHHNSRQSHLSTQECVNNTSQLEPIDLRDDFVLINHPVVLEKLDMCFYPASMPTDLSQTP